MTETSTSALRSLDSRKRSRDSDFENESSEESSNLTAKLSKSCDFCKVKKVKCSGESPCQFCIKNNQKDTCTYSLMKKPGLKRGYGKDMTQRLDYLENLVLQLKDQIDSLQRSHKKLSNGYQMNPISNSPQGASASVSVGERSTSSTFGRAKASPKSIQIPTLLNPTATHKANPRIVVSDELEKPQSLPSKSICLTLFKLFFDRIVPIFPIVHPNVYEQLEKSLYHDNQPRLLIYAIVLISLKFFQNESLLRTTERALIHDFCKDKVLQVSLKVVDLESLQSIALLAFDSLNDKTSIPECWNYVSLATDYAMHLKLNDEGQYHTSNLLANGNGKLQSVGVSPALELPPISQLRRDSSAHSLTSLVSVKSNNECDSKRNVYWCVYNLDKFYALTSLNSFKLHPPFCHLPSKLSFWFNNQEVEPISPNLQFRTLQNHVSNPFIYDSFADYIELNKIMGDILRFTKQMDDCSQHDIVNNNVQVTELKKTFKSLENDLLKWVSGLPLCTRSFIESAIPNSQQSHSHYQSARDPFHPQCSLSTHSQLEIFDILLYVQYYTAVVKLHSVIAYPNMTQLLSVLQIYPQASINQCLQASSKTSQLLSSLVKITDDESIFEKLGPMFGYGLFVNARVLIIDLIYTFKYQPNTQQTIANIENSAKILQCYQFALYKIGSLWSNSKIYFTILNQIDLVKLYHVLHHNFTSSSPAQHEFINSLSGGNKLVYWINLLIPQIERVLLRPGSSMIINPNQVQFAGAISLSYDEVWNLFVSDSLQNR